MGQRVLCGAGGGLTCTGPVGSARTQSAPCRGEEVAQSGAQLRSPMAQGDSGIPAGETHTLAFLPLGAVGAGQAALSLQTL